MSKKSISTRVPRLKPICLDFETEGIQNRPVYPPKPVSFSLQLPEWRAPRFYAWGHKTGGNNCSYEDAKEILTAVYHDVSDQTPLLCHNAKFDLDVAHVHFGLRIPPWHQFHDTLFLLFLVDPHARQLGLKPAAAARLGIPPDEQDSVKQWILAHKKQLEGHFPEIVRDFGGIKPSNTGAFIAYAPADVVESYANGDVVRTLALFGPLLAEVMERGMGPAYDRERRLLPILLRNETEGIRVDEPALAHDQPVFEKAQETADSWLRKALKAPGLDLDNDGQVGPALIKADAITEVNFTKTGRVSVSKHNLKASHFRDPKMAQTYAYRQKCATVLETFIRPWQRYAKNGRIHTNWNQVRQAKGGGGDTGGTRTGRPSSDSPNFLNMPKKFEAAVFPTHLSVPQLPRVRNYILPDEPGHVIGRRDYNQQELRLLAHFEDGMLLERYLKDPRLDVHQLLHNILTDEYGMDVTRTIAKNLNFGYIYGQGVGSLAEAMDREVDEVKRFRDAQMLALPGLGKLSKDIKQRTQEGLPIVTWGGREYYKEEPVLWQGRMLDFGYKLINYLIQGSAADVTKESIIRYDDVRKDGRFILTVYDENNISAPKKALGPEMLRLRDVMMSIEVDVPLISDGEFGPKLGSMEALKEPAPDLTRWIH